MNDIPRLFPWIGGTASTVGDAAFSPLVSPIDETVASHMIESDARIVDAAVKHAHRAYVAIGHIVQKQAFILAFSDMFFLLGVALIAALIAALLLKKPGHLDAGGAH